MAGRNRFERFDGQLSTGHNFPGRNRYSGDGYIIGQMQLKQLLKRVQRSFPVKVQSHDLAANVHACGIADVE